MNRMSDAGSSSSEADTWRPAATQALLRRRHELLRTLRNFFDSRGFLEVETPLLSRETVIDRHLDPLVVESLQLPQGGEGPWFLQTSPEFAMKRLLAAGSGPIYQICKAFRGGEAGPMHNPEFTMLEWYQPGLDYQAGRTQLAELASEVLGRGPCRQASFREIFVSVLGFDPHAATKAELQSAAGLAGITDSVPAGADREQWLDCLMVECIQPLLGASGPMIVFDWPGSQAALARTRKENGHLVAERFELYCDGVELANGYCELVDADELDRRMEENNQVRIAFGRPSLPWGRRLTDALRSGMPAGCGVALGVDRLLMVLTGTESLSDCLAFPWHRA